MIEDDLLRAVGRLTAAALAGTSEADIIALLCSELGRAGFDLHRVEIACDTVSPDRSNRFFTWGASRAVREGEGAATKVFHHMLEEGLSVLRSGNGGYGDGRPEIGFAPLIAAGATDIVAFASHIEPDAALGLFDDVMSLFSTTRPGGFSRLEVGFLERLVPTFALALSARLNVGTTRLLLDTYLGRDSAAALLGGCMALGEVGKVRAVVLYCDLLDFTGLTERLEPQDLIATLNLFFTAVTEPVTRAGGHVSGHVGDAAVMYFPIPDGADGRRVCAEAVRAARQALEAMDALRAVGSEPPIPLRARIGLDMGDIVHGNIGSAGRFSFTIIGPPVNRAARLQALAKEVGLTLLMSREVAQGAGVTYRSHGLRVLRGTERPVEVVGLP